MWKLGDSEESMIERGYIKIINPQPNTPWKEPGYTGKLRATIDISDVKPCTIDDLRELVDQFNIEGILTDERSERLHKRLDELSDSGQRTV